MARRSLPGYDPEATKAWDGKYHEWEAGLHLFEIVGSTCEPSKKGGMNLVLTASCTEGPDEGNNLKGWYSLHPQKAGRFKHIADVCGVTITFVDGEAEFDDEDFLGKQFKAVVSSRLWEGRPDSSGATGPSKTVWGFEQEAAIEAI